MMWFLLAGDIENLTVSSSYLSPGEQVKIEFDLNVAASIYVEVYDSSGDKVRTILSGQNLSTGHHTVYWDGKNDKGLNVGSGVYFYRLDAGWNLHSGC